MQECECLSDATTSHRGLLFLEALFYNSENIKLAAIYFLHYDDYEGNCRNTLFTLQVMQQVKIN